MVGDSALLLLGTSVNPRLGKKDHKSMVKKKKKNLTKKTLKKKPSNNKIKTKNSMSSKSTDHFQGLTKGDSP